ncbi:MAG: PIG-L deacetylase family protein [Acidimicrobiia bacterium]|nr:PIG-L deacetylase family protein [Acidimicrobiia bacterium]
MTEPPAPERALAIYAHPDDTEVACGGTLAKWADAGTEVRVLICTRGEKGTSDPDTDPDELAARRAAEVAEAAAVLGVARHELLGHPDGEIESSVALRGVLVERLRSFRPDVVLGHDPTAVFFGSGYVSHHDHRAVGWATVDACAPAASSPLYHPRPDRPTTVSTILLSGTLEPDTWIDIGEVVERKIRALQCHRSQVGDGEDVPEIVRQRAAGSGGSAGGAHLEAFRALTL